MRIQLVRRCQREDDGAVAVMVAVMAFVLFGMMAVVVDLGTVYATQRSLQNGADAAALAAGAVLIEKSELGDSCDEIASRAPQAQDQARNAFTSNAGSEAGLENDRVDVVCDATLGQVLVSAQGQVSRPSIFGGIFGYDAYELSKPAITIIGPPLTFTGLRPFAICQAAVGTPVKYDYLVLDFTRTPLPGCGSAPGNFGVLDFLDMHDVFPARSAGGTSGVPVVEPWITDGFEEDIPADAPIFIEGRPGSPASQYAEELEKILGKSITIPVYTALDDRGSNSVFTVQTFVQVQLCAYRVVPSGEYPKDDDCWSDEPTDLPADPDADRFLQLQFVDYVEPSDLNARCPIGDPDCHKGPLVLKLAD